MCAQELIAGARKKMEACMAAVGLKNVCGCLAWRQSGDEGVALESCEFWSAFCEAAVAQPDRLSPDVLRPFLGRLVPVLLKNMARFLLRCPCPPACPPACQSCAP